MIRIVSIKFRTAGKQYDFDAGDFSLQPGDRVVVETDRGKALGTVVASPGETPPHEAPDNLKKVLRMATDKDLEMAASSEAKKTEAFQFCQERIRARGMEMKLVSAEYLFDGSKIIFYFTADGRVDFRELVKDLAHHFHTRIEMRQIGVRDEAKITGGIGVCGRELCCCTFLTSFAPVSVKMAKEQGLALNPNKISGQCGRLLCCLNYEYDTYRDLKKGLPKCGCKVQVEEETGEVVSQNILAHTVTVKLPDNRSIEVGPEAIEPAEKPIEPATESPKPKPKPKTRKTGVRSQGARRKPQGDEVSPGAGVASEKPADQTGQAQSKPPRKRGRRRGRGKGRPQSKTPSGEKNE
jgi:cell fate regulator YaaT (PSP1 superfamily)